MDLVIVCELIKLFHSKCTNKLICIYVCTVYVPICMCVCAYSCMRMLEPKHSLGKAYKLSSFDERKNTHIV